jgi:AcrR family transcriptional regulator
VPKRPPEEPTTNRRPRADAERNRQRILTAAGDVFAARGTNAPTEEVARAAGVGIATVFRHFPTKHDLLEAVFVAVMASLAERARALADADDPADALFSFLREVVEVSTVKSTYTDALVAGGVDIDAVLAPQRRELPEALGALLARAQDAGAVRTDVGVSEVIALAVGVSRAVEHLGAGTDARRRTLAIVFDGLRAPARADPRPTPVRRGARSPTVR